VTTIGADTPRILRAPPSRNGHTAATDPGPKMPRVSTRLNRGGTLGDGNTMAHVTPPRRAIASRRLELGQGAATTVHIAVYPRDLVTATVLALAAPEPLHSWCARSGVRDALVGGFFVTPHGPALGEVWTDGRRVPTVPFDAPFADQRACLHLDGDHVSVAPLGVLPTPVRGDLLQAGPALVADGRALVRDGDDREGFSAGHSQFDSDITAGRHPRAAIGLDANRLVAVASEGRAPGEAGLTLGELAALMEELGAREAINLDGGGSTSLVVDGNLVNRPRDADGSEIPGGRPVVTAVAFVERSQGPQRAAAA
jgi:Phosphodiester glycosidase